MKLHYYQSASGNYGDDLNAWIWPKYIDNLENDGSEDKILGIGTILGSGLDKTPGTKHVLGSGYRNKPNDPASPSMKTAQFVFVRGLLTCKKLGLPESYAVGDPALLLREQLNRGPHSGNRVGFMPHYLTCNEFDCQKIADRSGLVFIDPRGTVDQVHSQLLSVSKLITEAMHGAIVADALNIPWVRVVAFSQIKENPEVTEFKWKDWASVFGISVQPDLTLYLPYKGRNRVNRIIKAPYVASRLRSFCKALAHLKSTGPFRCSPDDIKDSQLKTMKDKIDAFNRKLSNSAAP